MLTRRNFLVMLIMFLVVFVMFMLVDISTSYLTRHEYNPQADVPISIRADQAFSIRMFDAAAAPEGAMAQAVQGRPRVAIIADDAASVNVLNMQEWCMYNRFRYQVYTQLPAAAELADCRAVLFDTPVSDAQALETLRAWADMGIDMIFMQLPSYQELQAAPDAADFYGIDGFVQEALPLRGMYIFEDFFIGGERLYTIGDIYGESDDDVPQTMPYYSLRPGYLLFVQAVAQDESIDYQDLPGLVWRTSTGAANVFVANTDLFGGKNLPGFLTACLSQTETFHVYPVVNAQTISVVDFPMLADENAGEMNALYSRSAEALGRDVLWPSIVKILKNYGSKFNFFMATELDYSDAIRPSGELISFYRQEIERQSGTMGLSLQQYSDMPIEVLCTDNAAFLAQNMPDYRFTAACVTGEQLQALAEGEHLPEPLGRVSLLMTDLKEDAPLMSFLGEETVAVAFTTDGYVHETLDDLRLLCIENALGMNNQKVELSRAFYPQNGEDWNALNLRWSRNDTYQKPYRGLIPVTIYGLEERVRTFLALDYSTSMAGDVITLEVTNGVENTSFVLRLHHHRILEVEGGSCSELSSTAYLLQPDGTQMKLRVQRQHVIHDAPDTFQEVIGQ